MLAGRARNEDAVVLSVPPGKALVQTVDILAPIVNDAFAFGRIAAANALSDVYALGGEPWCAMNVACFPQALAEDDHEQALTNILRGGQDALLEAGAVLAGLRRQGAGLFFWLDSLGLALAACLGAMRGLTLGLGAAGALVLGLLAGLAPGLLRDMALGDTARAVEESWYATAAALGGMLTIGLARLPWRPSGWALSGAQWEYACIACGVLLVTALRFWRGRRNPD